MNMQENQIRLISKSQLFAIDYNKANYITNITYKQNRSQINDKIFAQICHKLGLFINVTNLKLKFDDCIYLFDIKGFKDMMLNIKKLTSLSLSFNNCQELNDKSIQSIIESIEIQKLNLTRFSIDLYNCAGLSELDASKLLKKVQQWNNLTKLKLNFGWCQLLSNDIIKEITSCLQNKPNLIQLHLSFHYVNSIQTLYEFPSILGTLVKLNEFSISLGGCSDLQEIYIIQLIMSIKNLIYLNKLEFDIFDCVNVSESTISLLGNCLISLKFLKQLNLEIGSLRIKSASDLGECLSQLQNLKELSLDISLNHSLKSGVVGNYFGQMKHLEKFYFSFPETDTSNKDFLNFVSNIPSLQNLQFLNINFNGCGIGTQEQIEFGSSIKELKNLRSLTINSNCIGFDFPQTLLDSIKLIKKLNFLKVDGQIFENFKNKFFNKFQKISNLVVLNLFQQEDDEFFDDNGYQNQEYQDSNEENQDNSEDVEDY